MDSRLTPHLARAYEIMADGEWHDREEIMREMAKVITPGAAVRHAELLRKLSGPRQSPAERKIPRSTEFLIASGKRAMAKSALRAKRVEQRVEDGVTQVRLRPPRLKHSDQPGRRKPTRKTVTPLPDPATLSPHLRAALEALQDGHWHPQELVLNTMVKVVDRDLALTVGERRRQDDEAKRESEARRRAGLPERRRRRYEQVIVDAGARILAVQALVNTPRIEQRDLDGSLQVRLRLY